MPIHYRKKSADSLHYLPANGHHPANTYFHFSFADYHDPDNMNFGALRVFNDDNVKPNNGFDRHPHRDVEIVSYLISGRITHWDNATQQEEVLGRGHVQAVTAGTGIWHSEQNRHDEWCHFLQIWILPPARSLPVRYGSHKFTEDDRRNKLAHIVGSLQNNDDAPLLLNQDVNFYVSELTNPEAEVTFELKAGRQAYINNFEGAVTIKDLPELGLRDSIEVVGPARLTFKAKNDHAHFIVIEMKHGEFART